MSQEQKALTPCCFGSKCGDLKKGHCDFKHPSEEIAQVRAASDGVPAGSASRPVKAAATGQRQKAPVPKAKAQPKNRGEGGRAPGTCFVCGKLRKGHPDGRFCSPPEGGQAP